MSGMKLCPSCFGTGGNPICGLCKGQGQIPNTPASPKQQALALLRGKLDPTTHKLVESLLGDGERLAVIRDTFLVGRDLEAVELLRDLDDNRDCRPFQLLPIHAYEPTPPGRFAAVVVRPQLGPFKVTNLLLGRRVAPYFIIEDIRVGNRSQFIQAGSIDGDIFESEVADMNLGDPGADGLHVLHIGKKVESRLGLPINVETCQVSQDLVIAVTNTDTQPRIFTALFLGTIKEF